MRGFLLAIAVLFASLCCSPAAVTAGECGPVRCSAQVVKRSAERVAQAARRIVRCRGCCCGR